MSVFKGLHNRIQSLRVSSSLNPKDEQRRVSSTYDEMIADPSKVKCLKFVEKTAEAQLISIRNHILIVGSWKNRRCIAYKIPASDYDENFKSETTLALDDRRPSAKASVLKRALSIKAINKGKAKTSFTAEEKAQAVSELLTGPTYIDFASYPDEVLPSGHTLLHFTVETNPNAQSESPAPSSPEEKTNDTQLSDEPRLSSTASVSLIKHDTLFSMGGFNKRAGKHFLFMEYNHNTVDKLFDTKTDVDSDDEKDLMQWEHMIEKHSDVPHYGGGLRCAIVGESNEVLLIVGGERKPYGIDVFDLKSYQYVKRFKTVLPWEPDNSGDPTTPGGDGDEDPTEDFKWTYHGLVRVDTNKCLLWKDHLCYIMEYNCDKQEFTFVKNKPHPCKLMGFAFTQINEKYIATFGGLDVTEWQRTNKIWVYAVESHLWIELKSILLPTRLWNSSACMAGDGSSIHIIGGVDDDGHHHSNHWILKTRHILDEVSTVVALNALKS